MPRVVAWTRGFHWLEACSWPRRRASIEKIAKGVNRRLTRIPPMNLRQMEVFRAVMVSGGVNSAAALLHVSPPAISKVLAQAAKSTGLVLFERVRGRLIPTPEAQQL